MRSLVFPPLDDAPIARTAPLASSIEPAATHGKRLGGLGIFGYCYKAGGLLDRRSSHNLVMAGLVPGIHVFGAGVKGRRGWPGQARPRRRREPTSPASAWCR